MQERVALDAKYGKLEDNGRSKKKDNRGRRGSSRSGSSRSARRTPTPNNGHNRNKSNGKGSTSTVSVMEGEEERGEVFPTYISPLALASSLAPSGALEAEKGREQKEEGGTYTSSSDNPGPAKRPMLSKKLHASVSHLHNNMPVLGHVMRITNHR